MMATPSTESTALAMVVFPLAGGPNRITAERLVVMVQTISSGSAGPKGISQRSLPELSHGQLMANSPA
jgi:hypothetical protein